ncbi:MAG: G8 domain-containing protein, partial [Planctomycetota bacterium]
MNRSTTLHLLFAVVLTTALSANAQHEHDPEAVQNEHGAAFDLVAHADATHMAIHSGNWHDPGTWRHLAIPDDLSQVVIMSDVEVVLDRVNDVVHKTIRVDGTLRMATDTNTTLRVDTMVIGRAGHLHVGDAENPVANGVNSRLIIADTGAIDTHWDPNELSRGLISHGRVTMHGATKTAHADLAVGPRRYDKQL